MGLQPEAWGLGFFFFSAAYGSTEMLRFLSESRKWAVVTVIAPLENADLLALQCTPLLFYSKTHSDLLEPDFIGTVSVKRLTPLLNMCWEDCSAVNC